MSLYPPKRICAIDFLKALPRSLHQPFSPLIGTLYLTPNPRMVDSVSGPDPLHSSCGATPWNLEASIKC